MNQHLLGVWWTPEGTKIIVSAENGIATIDFPKFGLAYFGPLDILHEYAPHAGWQREKPEGYEQKEV